MADVIERLRTLVDIATANVTVTRRGPLGGVLYQLTTPDGRVLRQDASRTLLDDYQTSAIYKVKNVAPALLAVAEEMKVMDNAYGASDMKTFWRAWDKARTALANLETHNG